MWMSDALRKTGATVRVTSLPDIAGLDGIVVARPNEADLAVLSDTVRDYVALLCGIEERLDSEARPRAERWLSRFDLQRLPNGELPRSNLVEFRRYEDWIIDELTDFGAALVVRKPDPAHRSAASVLIRGLSEHTSVTVSAIRAEVDQLREWNRHEIESDFKLDEREPVQKGLRAWRLPATTLIMLMIDLGGVELSRTDEEVISDGFTAEEFERLMADVVLSH